jgi:hypothetical protein
MHGRDPSTAERDSKGESRSFAQDDKSGGKIKSSGQECPLDTSTFYNGIPSAADRLFCELAAVAAVENIDQQAEGEPNHEAQPGDQGKAEHQAAAQED